MSENIKEYITLIGGSLLILVSVWNLIKSRGSRGDNSDSDGAGNEQRAALEREREIIAEQRKAAERERDIATDQRNTLSEQREAIDNQSDNISEQRELINTQRELIEQQQKSVARIREILAKAKDRDNSK